MNSIDLPEIPGFLSDHLLTAKGYQGWWKSNFSILQIHSSGSGYRVTHDDVHPFKGNYYDTLEEAVYHVRYRAITNFLGDEY